MSPTISKNSSASRRVLVILALLLFIVALILVIVSSIMPGTKKKISSFGGSYAEGYKVAREQAYRSGMAKMTAMSISGTVDSISSDSIKVKTNLFVDERVDGVGQVRTVLINRSTKIEKQIQKDQQAFQKEQNAYMESMKNLDPDTQPPTPPQPFDVQELKISDLKQGDMVNVMVEGNEDLMLKDSIQAKTIQVTVPMVQPAVQNAPVTVPSGQ